MIAFFEYPLPVGQSYTDLYALCANWVKWVQANGIKREC